MPKVKNIQLNMYSSITQPKMWTDATNFHVNVCTDIRYKYKLYTNTHVACRQNCPVLLLRLKSQNWKSGTSK